MFDNLLMRFRLTRRWLKRKVMNSLSELITKVDQQGSFNPEDISTLHNIVKSPVVRFNEDHVLGADDSIKFYTNTSMCALGALQKKDEPGLMFGKNVDMTTNPIERPFARWYSNRASVELFVGELGAIVERQSLLGNRIVDNSGELLYPLTVDEELFFESLIYRLLKLDMMEIIMFYLSRVED